MAFLKLFASIFVLLAISLLGFDLSNATTKIPEFNLSIPTAGNSWIINDSFQTSNIISAEGVSNWSDSNQIIRTYFYVEQPCKIEIGIRVKIKSGTSKIIFSFNSTTEYINLSNTEFKDIYFGEFNINKIGYHFVELQGIQKDNDTFAEVSEILLRSNANIDFVKYIKDDFYFGRRGPSTHLIFDLPTEGIDVAWFYNEIIIPEGQDVIGSYFMANGFQGGYYGIQVNSPAERRILFSIWSPYKTDDPSSIPEEFKIKLLKKGEDVNTGKFGNEGSGGQSYKIYTWKSRTKYKFLIGAKPTGDGSTDYTAYFFDPEVGKWDLIASFRRPKTDKYLTGLYSFLENFIPNTGVISRKGGFYNQWVCDADGTWHEIREAKFSADQTARKGSRFDYSGGVENGGFYLKNCGFTNDRTEIGTDFTRTKSKSEPAVDFSSLE